MKEIVVILVVILFGIAYVADSSEREFKNCLQNVTNNYKEKATEAGIDICNRRISNGGSH